jgi:outer membrane protein OmpA-like peptidoglycan-associated protein
MKSILIFFTALFCSHSWSQTETLSLFFKVNLNELTPSSAQKLDSLCEIGDLTSIKLSGYADARGNDSMNLLLSKSRVDAIQSALNSKGIQVAESSFFGENYPKDAKSQSNYAFWRRVDLSYNMKETGVSDLNTIDIESIKNGKLEAIPLQLEFYNMSADFMPYSAAELEKLFNFMQKNTSVKAFIRGHVCCSGGDVASYYSTLRAEAVHDYLVSKGISTERLTFKGFGNSMPLVWPELTDEDQQRNRRVDVIFSMD